MENLPQCPAFCRQLMLTGGGLRSVLTQEWRLELCLRPALVALLQQMVQGRGGGTASAAQCVPGSRRPGSFRVTRSGSSTRERRVRGLGFAVGEPVGSCMEKAGLAEKGFHTLHEKMDRNEFMIRLQALQAPLGTSPASVLRGSMVTSLLGHWYRRPQRRRAVCTLRSPQIF